jgi:hypothetical protein
VGRPTIPPQGHGGQSLFSSLRLGMRVIAVGLGGVKSRSPLAACVDGRWEPAPGADQWGQQEAGADRHLSLVLMGRHLIQCHSRRWVLKRCHRGHLQPHRGPRHCMWVRCHFFKAQSTRVAK